MACTISIFPEARDWNTWDWIPENLSTIAKEFLKLKIRLIKLLGWCWMGHKCTLYYIIYIISYYIVLIPIMK